MEVGIPLSIGQDKHRTTRVVVVVVSLHSTPEQALSLFQEVM
jgi:hypothetical protein